MLSVFKKNEKSLFPVRIVLFSECPLPEKDCVPKTETARYMKMHVWRGWRKKLKEGQDGFGEASLHLRSTFAPPSLPKGSNREGTRALRRRFGGKDMARHGGSGRKGLANRTVSSHSIHSTGHCRDAIITLLWAEWRSRIRFRLLRFVRLYEERGILRAGKEAWAVNRARHERFVRCGKTFQQKKWRN